MAPQPLHRQKRPFQPSITSYFGREDREECLRTTIPQRPVLEPSVQSDLLSVGMRIRKAVPEGYKTHKTILLYSSTPPPSNTAPSNARAYTSTRQSGPAELLPFCGLHKVGGHSVQNASAPVDSHEPIDIFADDRMPFSLPEESTSSTLSTNSMPSAPILNPRTTNKRQYLEDEEDEDIPPFQLHFSDPLNPLLAGLSVSPTRGSYPVSHTAMPDLAAISCRVMAKPRSRRKGTARALPEVIAGDIEFEEASFLEPWEDTEMDMDGI